MHASSGGLVTTRKDNHPITAFYVGNYVVLGPALLLTGPSLSPAAYLYATNNQVLINY